jgi:hypothetical protein
MVTGKEYSGILLGIIGKYRKKYKSISGGKGYNIAYALTQVKGRFFFNNIPGENLAILLVCFHILRTGKKYKFHFVIYITGNTRRCI